MTDKGYVYRLLLAAKGDEEIIKRILNNCGDIGYFTLQEIADIYSLTRERCRQIEAQALRKLKHPTIIGQFKNYYTLDCIDETTLDYGKGVI